MQLQYRMPLLPSDAEMVSEHLAVARRNGRITFFDASGPIFTCREDDEGSLRFASVILTEWSLGLATPSQLGKAIDRHRSRVHEYRKQYREGGSKAVEVKQRGPRGASKLKGIVLARAQKVLNEGKSNRMVAKLVGVSEGTIRKAIKEAFIEQGWDNLSADLPKLPEPPFRRFVDILRTDPKPDRGLRTLMARLEELDDYGFFDLAESHESLWESEQPIVIRIHATQNDNLQKAFA